MKYFSHIFAFFVIHHAFTASLCSQRHSLSDFRIVYENIDLESLPSLVQDNKTSNISDGQTDQDLELLCDRCKDKPAVKYCIDCGEKTCDHHIKVKINKWT